MKNVYDESCYRKRKIKEIMGTATHYLLLFIVAILSFFPILWAVLTAMKTPAEIYSYPLTYLPKTPTLENFIKALFETKFYVYIRNSIIVSVSVTLLTILISSLASYALARLRFRGRRELIMLVLFLIVFTSIAILPSVYLIFKSLGLVNTFISIILTHAGLFSPLATWILTNYFRSVPPSIEEAALIDGASVLRVIKDIVLPVSLPGLGATSIIVFTLSWCEFPFSLVLLTKDEVRTVVVGISLYPGEYAFPWHTILAATVIAIIPLLIFFLLFQRYIISGLTAGALKY